MPFDHARGFTPLEHYLYLRRCLTARTAAELDFWDILFAHVDPQTRLACLHIRRDVTAFRFLSRPTFYKLMARAEEMGIVHPPQEGLSARPARGEYLVELAPWPPEAVFCKPRAYVQEGWLKAVRGLTAKQVINLFCLALSQDAARRADDVPLFCVSDLRRLSGVLGRMLSHRALREALAALAELGLVEVREAGGLRRYTLNAARLRARAPGRKEIAAEVARLTGLSPEKDVAWVRLLTDFVEIGGHRLREVPTIYRSLLSLHPLLATARDLEALRANLRQRAPWRTTDYRVVLGDFVRERRAKRRVEAVRSQRLRLRFDAHNVVGEALRWDRETWKGVVSAVLRYEVRRRSPPHPDAAEGPAVWPQLFLWRQGSMIPLEAPAPDSSSSERRLRRLDLTRWLRGLAPTEPVSLVAALPSPMAGITLQGVVSLGVRI